jgi:peptidoglycan/xylan/chitin deacetylase (PgdA/CDA1 family)
MSDQGIQIGAHTRTHADLGKVTDADHLYDELVASGRELEQIMGHAVPFFAFPYGQHHNLSDEAFRMAREEGYQGVCSAYGGYNFPGDDAFHLQRIHADPEMTRFRNWMTVDPRKVAMVERYRYASDSAPVREVADVASIG